MFNPENPCCNSYIETTNRKQNMTHAAEQYTSDEIARIRARVESGYYDSTMGLRPDVVFVDRDGDIAISYPGGPNWMGWERKVA
jgi:hypothetical protein